MDDCEYERIWDEVERAYKLTETPEEFLNAVLRIWVEHGLMKGEISCEIDKAG
jgi:hypothetical protein